MADSRALDEIAHLDRFGDVPRQRLLARDSGERAFAALDRVDDLLDVLDARVIRPGEPDRVDRRIGDHVGDRRIWFRVADIEVAGELRGRRGVLLVRTPDAEDVGVAHRAKGLQVEARVESAADERDAEPLARLRVCLLGAHRCCGLTRVVMTS